MQNDPIVIALRTLESLPRVAAALEQVRCDQGKTLEAQKELVLIEAPSYHEEKKAQRYAQMLQDAGLEDVRIDSHFNVIGRIRGAGNTGKAVLLEGHLDTVFSFGDVKGIRTDAAGRIHCPGICDDTRALAANLSVARALVDQGIRPWHDIVIAGTVCEEGLGAMKGMKTLLEESKEEIIAAISIDGPTADRFYANATGMIDLSVTFEGPGGHAWTAFGMPSALHAACKAVALTDSIELPRVPKTTLTVSLIEGGQAIHGIAQKTTIKINARSNSQAELDRVRDALIACCRQAAQEESRRWGKDGLITVTSDLILDIPAGTQDEDCAVIRLAKAVTRQCGIEPVLMPGGCTNSSRAIAVGIPAVTYGRGGEEFGTHTLAEWFDPKGVYVCEQKSILTVLAIAGIAGQTEPLSLR